MKQFCLNDHDTLVYGRDATGHCRGCRGLKPLSNPELCQKQVHKITSENQGLRVQGGKKRPYCKTCRNESAQSKRGVIRLSKTNVCPENHVKTQAPDGRWRCNVCLNASRRQKRLDEEMRIPVDGMEGEFGACPPKANVRTWYDPVIVQRVIHGVHKPGRSLTTREIIEVVTRFKYMDVSIEEIARRCDVSHSSVSKWYAKYNEVTK